MWEPKLGDVVTLRSNPDRHMTVVAYQSDKKMYDVLWLNEQGAANAIAVSAVALQKVEEEAPAAPVIDPRATAEWQALVELAKMAETYKAEIAELKNERLRAILASRAVLEEVAADAQPDVLVNQIVDRFRQMKTESNEQISRLAIRVSELGG